VTLRRAVLVVAALCGFGVAACSGGGSSGTLPPASGPNRPALAGAPYHHIVVVIQENRSFDNMFAGAAIGGLVPNIEATAAGYNENCTNPNAPTTCQQVPLQATGFESPFDPDHSYAGITGECHFSSPTRSPNPNTSPCLMNGWENTPNEGVATYAFLPPAEIMPYIRLANAYGIADHFFSAGMAPSFPGHVFLLAGLGPADDPPHSPWGCPEPSGDRVNLFVPPVTGPTCYAFKTIADELTAANISWKYYTGETPANGWDGLVNGPAAFTSLYTSPSYSSKDVPRAQFFTDMAQSTTTCNLPSVSWITPNGNASDHPGFSNSPDGPYWVGTIYETIAQSPCYADTAILVLWDDSGGWYDHVPPPFQLTPAPPGLDHYRDIVVGMRVPLLFLAPNATIGVSKTPRDFGAVLAFIEHDFGLAALGGEDLDFGGDALGDMWRPGPVATISPIPQSQILSRPGQNYNAKYFLKQPETPPDNQ